MIHGMGVPDLPGKVSPQGGDIGARVQRELLVREAVPCIQIISAMTCIPSGAQLFFHTIRSKKYP